MIGAFHHLCLVAVKCVTYVHIMLKEDDQVFGHLAHDQIFNSDMAADIIINSIEEQALGATPMAPLRDAAEKPLPPARPPAMPARTTAADLLGNQQGTSSRQNDGGAEQDTLAISSDVQWQYGPELQRYGTTSAVQGNSTSMHIPSLAAAGPYNVADAPSLTFGSSCLLTGILLYAIHLGQQAETIAHGSGVKAMALLRQRQHQDFLAQHAVSETDDQTTEQRIQAARAKVCSALFTLQWLLHLPSACRLMFTDKHMLFKMLLCMLSTERLHACIALQVAIDKCKVWSMSLQPAFN